MKNEGFAMMLLAREDWKKIKSSNRERQAETESKELCLNYSAFSCKNTWFCLATEPSNIYHSELSPSLHTAVAQHCYGERNRASRTELKIVCSR
jgi:hypothetical protein